METAFPFILQNLHRYFLYLAFIPLFFLWIDAVPSIFPPSGGIRLGLGVFVLAQRRAADAATRCRATRCGTSSAAGSTASRARGGSQARYTLWQRLTALNRHHMAWAWASLLTVTLADVYVRMLALGIITDPAIRF